MQGAGVVGRDLRVLDAGAGRHEIDLPRLDHGVVPGRVAVLDLALVEPAHGLQSGVRMRRRVHDARARRRGGAVRVHEAPGADQRASALRKRAPHHERARPAERHLAGLEHLDAARLRSGSARLGQQHLRRILLEVAHDRQPM